jgi:competence protein ComEC
MAFGSVWYILIAYIAGLLSSRVLDPNPLPLYTGIWLGILALAASLLANRHRLAFPILLFCFVILGCLNHSLDVRPVPVDDVRRFADRDDAVVMEGRVVSAVTSSPTGQRMRVKVDSLWIRQRVVSVTGVCQLFLRSATPELRYGDHIVFRGRLERPSVARNPGGFDYRAYLARQGVHTLMYVNQATHVTVVPSDVEEGPLFQQGVHRVRRGVLSGIERYHAGEAAEVLTGLLLGSKDRMQQDLKDSFSNVGVIHILAVSGLHTGYVLMALLLVVSLFRCPEPVRTLIVLAGLYGFVSVVGFRSSVVRASIMAGLWLVGRQLGRPVQPLHILGLAALIILLIAPQQLFQAGFQFSFAAVMGIVLVLDIVPKWRPEPGRSLWKRGLTTMGTLALVSVSAQLTTLPLTVYYFFKIPLLALAANLLVIPLVGVIVVLGFITLVMHMISPLIASCYATVNTVCLSWLIHGVRWIDSLSITTLAVQKPSLMVLVLYYILLLLLLLWHRPRIRKHLLFFLLIFSTIWSLKPAKQTRPLAELTVLDVGQGDAVVCRFADGSVLMVDAGPCSDSFDSGTSVILPYLHALGIRRIHTLVVTHDHNDHIGGVPTVLNEIPVGRVVRARITDTPLSRGVDSLMHVHNIPLQQVQAGDSLFVSPLALCLVLHPWQRPAGIPFGNGDGLNNHSIVLLLHIGHQSILLTGDVEQEAESDLLRYGDLLSAPVVKVGHHGSETASSGPFVRRVDAKFAVVSVGETNRFGLPDKKPLQRWRRSGARVLRTDQQGAICFRVFDDSIRFNCAIPVPAPQP